MSISECDKLLEENKDIEQLVNGSPLIVSGVNVKPSEGFRSLLKQIKKNTNSRGIPSTINTW